MPWNVELELRNSASSFHWLSSSIFTVCCLLSRIGNTSSHLHYMMFQTIQTIYFLWGYDPGNMSVSFIAELNPVYCCLVRSVFVFLPVLSVDGFWLMMMMMAMTICFTEATRLLESSGSAVSVPQEEEQQYKMSKEWVQCAVKMYNVQWKCAMCNENVQCAMKMYNVQWKCTITISMTIQHFNTITGFACISIRPLGSTGCPCVYNIAQGTYRLYTSLGPYRIFMHLYVPRAI